MYKVTIKQTRPTPETLFFFEYHKYPADYRTYIDNTFVKTGKLLSRLRIHSEDRMSFTQIMEWRSKSDFLEFLTDEYRYNNSSKAFNYNETHGILVEVTVEKLA